MSDVRAELANVVATFYRGTGAMVLGRECQVADVILARFDVGEKPVVTAEELGRMVAEARKEGRPFAADQGKAMFRQLEALGLRIVRAEDGHR